MRRIQSIRLHSLARSCSNVVTVSRRPTGALHTAASSAAATTAAAASASLTSSAASIVPSIASEYDIDSILGRDRPRPSPASSSSSSSSSSSFNPDRALLNRILARSDRERELRNEQLARILSSNSGFGLFDDDSRRDLDSLLGGSGPPAPKKLSMKLRCFSFAVVGKEHLQMGDKVILAPEALYQVNRIRLPFPLLFRIEKEYESESEKAKDSKLNLPAQYAGVLEFSAPEEHIYLPSWMMENLRLSEGSTVRIHSETGIEQGKWVKLIPHSIEFSKILRELGPKYFLEMALRHYSVLTKGQRILVTHDGQNYSLDVADAKPSPTISLLGNLDLEVEFGIALDTPYDQREDAPLTFRGRVSGGHVGVGANDDDNDEDLKRALAMSLAEAWSHYPSMHRRRSHPTRHRTRAIKDGRSPTRMTRNLKRRMSRHHFRRDSGAVIGWAEIIL